MKTKLKVHKVKQVRTPPDNIAQICLSRAIPPANERCGPVICGYGS